MSRKKKKKSEKTETVETRVQTNLIVSVVGGGPALRGAKIQVSQTRGVDLHDWQLITDGVKDAINATPWLKYDGRRDGDETHIAVIGAPPNEEQSNELLRLMKSALMLRGAVAVSHVVVDVGGFVDWVELSGTEDGSRAHTHIPDSAVSIGKLIPKHLVKNSKGTLVYMDKRAVEGIGFKGVLERIMNGLDRKRAFREFRMAVEAQRGDPRFDLTPLLEAALKEAEKCEAA